MTPNPCYNNGSDCPRRCLGCRTTCEDWSKWLVIHEAEKAKERQQKFTEADDYTKCIIEQNLKRTKRRIGQK